MVDGDDRRAVANPANSHRLGKPGRRRDLRGHRISRVGDIRRPVDIHRAGNVGRQIFFSGASIRRLLDARSHRLRGHESPDVDHADFRVAQVLSQPVGRDDEAQQPWIGFSGGIGAKSRSLRLATRPAVLQVLCARVGPGTNSPVELVKK